MDFDDTPQEAEFRAEVRKFLAGNAERRKPGTAEGYRTSQAAPGALERAKAWQAKKAAAGFAGITWPKDWCGRGGSGCGRYRTVRTSPPQRSKRGPLAGFTRDWLHTV